MDWQEYLTQVDQASASRSGPELELFFKEALHSCRKEYGVRSLEYASLLKKLGEYYDQREQLERAEGCFQEVQSLLAWATGTQCLEYGAALNRLANIHRRLKRYEEAEWELSASLELCRRTVGERHPLFACGLEELSRVYLERGRPARAAELRLRAEELFSALPREGAALAVS